MRGGGRPAWASMWLQLGALGLLVVVAVGLAAKSPASLSDDPWGLRRPDPQVVGVVLLGMLVLGLVVLVLGLLDRRNGEPLPARRPRWQGALFLLLVVAGLVVARALLDGGEPREVTAPDPSPTPSAPAPLGEGAAADGGSPLLALALLSLVVMVTAWAARRRRALDDPLVVEDAPDALGLGLSAAAGSLRASADHTPRARVIAAYAAFEQALAATSGGRAPSSTPARLLADAVAHGAPAGPASLLTELFTRARYADSRVTARDVTEAERALDALLATR